MKPENGLDWDDVRVFLVIARAGQILSAARKLGIDHATASRHLTALEGGLGARLVERRTSGSSLTPAGERLKVVAERVESELVHIQSELTYSGLSLSGSVTITVPECFGYFFLTSHIRSLLERYPELSVRLVSLPQMVSLTKRDADLAITFGRPAEGRFTARKLVEFAYGAFASRQYLKMIGPITLESDLRRRTLVVSVNEVTPNAGNEEANLIRSAGRTLECANVMGQFRAIESGVGFGVLPYFVARQSPELVPILPHLKFLRSFWIVTHLDVRDIRRIREVQRFIASAVKANAAIFTDTTKHLLPGE